MKKRDGTGDFTEYSLEKDEPENICKLGMGPECCIYLAVDAFGWVCAKHSGIGNSLRKRLKSGKSIAKGEGGWEGCPWSFEVRTEEEKDVTDEDGAQMIVDLQKLANINEPFEVALKNWKLLSDSDKANTVIAHHAMFTKE